MSVPFPGRVEPSLAKPSGNARRLHDASAAWMQLEGSGHGWAVEGVSLGFSLITLATEAAKT